MTVFVKLQHALWGMTVLLNYNMHIEGVFRCLQISHQGILHTDDTSNNIEGRSSIDPPKKTFRPLTTHVAHTHIP